MKLRNWRAGNWGFEHKFKEILSVAYTINFDGLKREVCELSAWMLSYNGAEHLVFHESLFNSMREIHRERTSSLIISIAAQLRIIRDTTNSYPSNAESSLCGEIFNNYCKEGNQSSSDIGVDISFYDAIDKILHATIEVDRFRSIGSEGTKFIVELIGKEKRGKSNWQVELDMLLFADLAIKFLDDKQKILNR